MLTTPTPELASRLVAELATRTGETTTGDLLIALGIERSRATEMFVADVCTRCGWEKTRTMKRGIRHFFWRKTKPGWVDPLEGMFSPTPGPPIRHTEAERLADVVADLVALARGGQSDALDVVGRRYGLVRGKEESDPVFLDRIARIANWPGAPRSAPGAGAGAADPAEIFSGKSGIE